METNIVIELIVLGIIIVIGFLAIKLGLVQDEVVSLKKENQILKTEKLAIERDFCSLHGKHLNLQKQVKNSQVTNHKPVKKGKGKDFIQSLNEMNKHSGK